MVMVIFFEETKTKHKKSEIVGAVANAKPLPNHLIRFDRHIDVGNICVNKVVRS